MRNLRKILRKKTGSVKSIGRRPKLKLDKKAVKQALMEEDSVSENSDELRWNYDNNFSPVRTSLHPNACSNESISYIKGSESNEPCLGDISEEDLNSKTEPIGAHSKHTNHGKQGFDMALGRQINH